MPDISEHGIRTVEPVHPGVNKVTIVFDVPEWPQDTTYAIRAFAEEGEHLFNPWFAVLRVPGEKSLHGVRDHVVLNNNRFLFKTIDEPREGGPLGMWGWSWYLINTGPSVGPTRIEVGFLAEMRHPPAMT